MTETRREKNERQSDPKSVGPATARRRRDDGHDDLQNAGGSSGQSALQLRGEIATKKSAAVRDDGV
jgi:hypothetical protein